MDVFASLGAGIRFDKKRFRQDIEIFQKGRSAAINPISGHAANLAEAQLAPAVDFFETESSAAKNADTSKEKNNVREKSRKRTASEANSVFNDSEIELRTEEQIAVFRKQHKIRVYGNDDCVPPIPSFTQLFKTHGFSTFVSRAVGASGYRQPTPIQMQTMPIMLSGHDLIACAPTGSGKTLAYLLPLVHLLGSPSKEGIRAVIISPTRELAQQIHRELELLVPSKKGLKAVLLSKSNVSHTEKKYDVLITTPMRLVHAIEQKMVDLHHAKFLIMDEADKLFEMGFLEQIDSILAACTCPQIQKSLFSATIHSHVEQMAQTVMKDPIRVVIGSKNSVTEDIDQQLLYVGQEEGKLVAIRQLIQQGLRPPVLIFVESIERAKELFHELIYDGINVDVIHSDRTQAQRDQIIQNFRAGKTWVLIATELLGRGLDFKGVQLVINYDFPRSLSSYIHRIGRTGRAGQRGKAITYFTKEDAGYLRTIAQVMRDSGCEIPDWMLKLPKPSKLKYLMRKEQQRKDQKEGKNTTKSMSQ